ncbi:MAG: hypothetical protein KKC79_20330 [Gammaproteobacteria bacterium]|nr:hypothetical protein [Gammaproteobacteria bacterium]MBU1443512.1 hypothetical protein [Gammaproteobacteria bacterium]MBU2288828.1 hypothetical protein [Gammaproteobacteria bacterium]MBU2410985.1 hypothetical protein [Gammaproteobacteria bacterium]
MSEIHISVWISVAMVVVIVVLFLDRHLIDDRWHEKIARIERALGWLLLLVLMIGIPLAAVYFYLH